MEALPDSAAVVVIGAGAIGCSIAYHLARRGRRDVLVLEREAVGADSSGRVNDGIRSRFGLQTEVRFSPTSLGFLARFEVETGVDDVLAGDPHRHRVAQSGPLRPIPGLRRTALT
ncbi:MAG TPA: FAD-dependent oxidoreductase [Chloroflexota bacterium]|jgi:sarcosine oxidase subunit beta